MSVEFNKIFKLVEFNGFLRYINISGNFTLVDPNRFSGFWFKV